MRFLYFLVSVAGMLALFSGCGREPAVSGEAASPFSASGWFQGYASSIGGGIIEYHSPHPDVTSALLVRSLDTRDFIEWQSEPVPQNFVGEAATFVWIFGMDVDADPHSYDLSVNGEAWFRFANPMVNSVKEWTVDARNGARLHFRVTMIDRHGDVFGYIALHMPAGLLPRGKPLRFRVAGESAGSRVWYMTFQNEVRVGAEVVPQPAIVRREGGLYQPVHVHLVHLGLPETAHLEVEGADPEDTQVVFGFNRVILYLPQTETEARQVLEIQRPGQDTAELEFTRRPVRPWYLYMVQHTHTDIGYTRPQTEILAEHLRFIDYALDYCDLTDSFPDDSRFRWTCEASWAVDEYLRIRPASQIKRLKQRITEGRIEVTAMPFNLSEIADENMLARSLGPLARFHDQGIRVTTAMQNDVNGIGWCLADFFPDTGVRYLTMGQHGHRARIPFDKPTAFWWESPSGRRLLAFRADHYNTGNFWGIHTGRFENTEEALLLYLSDLEAKSYPFDHLSVQYAGYFTDNSPPATVGCEFIREWNQKYVWPRLRSATAREFLTHIEQKHGDELPVYRVSWPDWWSDGFGSAARETATARLAQARFTANQGLLVMARLLGARLSPDLFRRIEKIGSALLFWDEHTMGAAESISDPLAENSMVQWAEKSSYVWEAAKENRLLQEAAMGLIQAYIPLQETASVAVFNSQGHPRSGLVEIYVDHEIIPPGRDFHLKDVSGKEVPAQKSQSRADGTYWFVQAENVPALGFHTYRIEALQTARPAERSLELKALQDGEKMGGMLLENEFYRLVIDPDRGGITSLVDKEWGEELVDADSPWLMGQFILERISNRGQLERFRLVDHERSSLNDVKIETGVNGPLWQSLSWSGTTDTAISGTRLRCEVRLFKRHKRLELHYVLFKKDITDPEALYVAFPFRLDGGTIHYEIQGGEVIPGKDQLEGTATDWNALQNYCAVRDQEGGQVVLSSPEIPLVHFGGLNLGEFRYVAQVERPHVYSWVMNNYWVTNFRASQRGEFRWSYAITSGTGTAAGSRAARFGWDSRIPLLTRVFPPARSVQKQKSFSLLEISEPNILLVAARPLLGGEVILHVRELEGRESDFEVFSSGLDGRKYSLIETNALSEPIGQPTVHPRLKAFETKFFRLIYKR
ncbi:MAG: glycoside hydrolase family 38 C-terminal domain-containing protein [Candidatus Aminicenantaceae bacterium]